MIIVTNNGKRSQCAWRIHVDKTGNRVTFEKVSMLMRRGIGHWWRDKLSAERATLRRDIFLKNLTEEAVPTEAGILCYYLTIPDSTYSRIRGLSALVPLFGEHDKGQSLILEFTPNGWYLPRSLVTLSRYVRTCTPHNGMKTDFNNLGGVKNLTVKITRLDLFTRSVHRAEEKSALPPKIFANFRNTDGSPN